MLSRMILETVLGSFLCKGLLVSCVRLEAYLDETLVELIIDLVMALEEQHRAISSPLHRKTILLVGSAL